MYGWKFINSMAIIVGTCILMLAGSVSAQYVPTKRDSGWVPLFNGVDLEGLYPHYAGNNWGEDPLNIISVSDSMIHFYQGFKYKNSPPDNYGVLSTGVEFSWYYCRVEYKHGDYTTRDESGWLKGDPYNSGFFYHAKPGGPVWPPCIECQLKRHWNAGDNQPCTAADGDCDRVWAADFWILGGAQIERDGQKTNLGGCCNPMLVDRNEHPDYELEGWNRMEVRVWSDSLFQNVLNGHVINYGNNSTYENPQGQRVPLTEGRVQLELEGSEISFRNWEIKLMPKDPLYDSFYVEGCMDTAFLEYSEEANLHISDLCVTAAVRGCTDSTYNEYNPDANVSDPEACLTLSVNVGGNKSFGVSFDDSRLTLSVSSRGRYVLTLYDIHGNALAEQEGRNEGRHNFHSVPGSGIYFCKIRTDKGIYLKRIMRF